jgi:uncharacterized Fe-S cluster protein YjdI
MSKLKKNYTNGEITVVWQPDLCIHSANCFEGLPGVFDPKKRPWITMDGASTEEIGNQVKQCPSGALSYYLNVKDKNKIEMNEEKIKIDISDDGPILVSGPVIIKYKGGEEVRSSKVTALCRCGASSNKPYCDGSHRRAEFKG